MQPYSEDWDLATVPDAALYSEAARRRGSKRATFAGGRPKKLRKCRVCGVRLGVAEMRRHKHGAAGGDSAAVATPKVEPTPKQRIVLEATESELLLTGGRGGGMTTACLLWLGQEPDGVIVKETALDAEDVQELLESCGHAVTSISLEEALSGSLKSRTVKRIAFDIPAPWLKLRAYRDILRSARAERSLIATPPPLIPRKHWLYKRFMQSPFPRRRVISIGLDDNPYLADDARFRRMLEVQYPDTRKQWAEGAW